MSRSWSPGRESTQRLCTCSVNASVPARSFASVLTFPFSHISAPVQRWASALTSSPADGSTPAFNQ